MQTNTINGITLALYPNGSTLHRNYQRGTLSTFRGSDSVICPGVACEICPLHKISCANGGNCYAAFFQVFKTTIYKRHT